MNIKAKQNFIRCFIQLENNDSKDQEFARSYANEVCNDQTLQVHLNLYQKAKVLFKIRYLSDALESANKAMEFGSTDFCLDLIKQIQKEIDMKKKR